MNQFLIVLAVLSLFINSSMSSDATNDSNAECQIDATNKTNTINNLSNYCNSTELQEIFSSLEAGTFPNGTYKGYVLTCYGTPCEWAEIVWKGKTITYVGGTPPNDHGTVINAILTNRIELFSATIYRTDAPIDGNQAFAIDYQEDIFTFWVMDYIREVQENLYLGIATITDNETVPVVYFLLELDN